MIKQMNFYLYLAIIVGKVALAEDFDFEASASVISNNSSATFCEKGSLEYTKLSKTLNDAILGAANGVNGVDVLDLVIDLCPSKHGFKLNHDQKAASVIFPILAAGAFVISVLFVRWKNMEREELILRRKKYSSVQNDEQN